MIGETFARWITWSRTNGIPQSAIPPGPPRLVSTCHRTSTAVRKESPSQYAQWRARTCSSPSEQARKLWTYRWAPRHGSLTGSIESTEFPDNADSLSTVSGKISGWHSIKERDVVEHLITFSARSRIWVWCWDRTNSIQHPTHSFWEPIRSNATTHSLLTRNLLLIFIYGVLLSLTTFRIFINKSLLTCFSGQINRVN